MLKEVSVGVFVYPPFINDCNVTQASSDQSFPCNKPGIGFEITYEACRFLNLTCHFHYVPQADFGSQDDHKNWTGMLGSIFEGRFDTSFPQFSPTETRLRDFILSLPIMQLPSAFLIRNPFINAPEMSFVSFLMPFQWQVSLIFVIMMLIVGTLFTWYELKQGERKRLGSIWLSRMINVVGLAINQGANDMVLTSATYVLMGIWALISVVFVGFYSAILLSTLLNTKHVLPFYDIPSFAACVQAGKCSWLTFSTHQRKYENIMSAEQGDLKQLRNAFEAHPPQVVPLNETVETIAKSPGHWLAFWQTEIAAANLVGFNCNYLIVRDRSYEIEAFPFAKHNTKLMRLFNKAQQRFLEIGLMERITAKYIQTRVCESLTKNAEINVVPFPMRSLIGPIFIVTAGAIAGMISLACEIGYARYYRKTQGNNFRAENKDRRRSCCRDSEFWRKIM